MKYALVNDIKKEALESGERGICRCCNSEMIAHCGPQKVNHWKHKTLVKCDIWHEPETEWHRRWKNYFPSDSQEVVMFDEKTNEKHIADVHLFNLALTIEFQHSPIKIDEIKSREKFYKKMIWVIDLIPFLKNISLHQDLKETFLNSVALPWANNSQWLLDELKQNYIDIDGYLLEEDKPIMHYMYQFEMLCESYNNNEDYFLLLWKYQHKRWNYPEMPIFFDLGDEFIYMNIESMKYWNGFLVKRFLRSDFIRKYHDQQGF